MGSEKVRFGKSLRPARPACLYIFTLRIVFYYHRDATLKRIPAKAKDCLPKAYTLVRVRNWELRTANSFSLLKTDIKEWYSVSHIKLCLLLWLAFW